MAWKKSASKHIPDWLDVQGLSLSDLMKYYANFLTAGLIAGVIAGMSIGLVKNEDWNKNEIALKQFQKMSEKNLKIGNQLCREMPEHLSCEDNLKRLCTRNPNNSACSDFRECKISPGQPKCAQFKSW